MILKTLGLVAALVGMSVAPALADSACQEPIAPAAVDGANATTAQMNGAHDDVVTFIKQSDDYQACLYKELNDAKADAVKNKKDLDPSIEAGVNAKIDSNQHLKEKVGGEFNAAVMAYKAKHPNG
ncbi:MAG TPA: hypothetical protein VMJ73_16695 [Rhizomicrobium sp.]|nr:hypothetical protein [Rhizomicrobium sp.]